MGSNERYWERLFDEDQQAEVQMQPTPNIKRIIEGGQPTCKVCGQPAMSISLPGGIPVCGQHDDNRTK